MYVVFTFVGYLVPVPDNASNHHEAPSCYAPSSRVERFACGRYGVGHTARRQPGETRGTVVGKKGRFKKPATH